MSAARKEMNVYLTKLAEIMSVKTGVQLGDKQLPMIESRLMRRMKQVNVNNWEEYYKYFEKNIATELDELISLLTTHHSFFFREFLHFEALEKYLPQIIEQAHLRSDKTIKIWSAACSRGQEVYSLSMFMAHHLATLAPDLKYSILGTDIDRQSVSYARNGVYPRDEIKQIPLMYLSTHWARGTGEISEFVKAKNSIKSNCQFEYANLLDIPELVKKQKFDIIFCRNVFIYFAQEQIKSVTKNMLNSIQPGGLFFVSVSETLKDLQLPVESIGPAIYQQSSGTPSVAKTPLKLVTEAKQKPENISQVRQPIPVDTKAETVEVKPSQPLRVFCIDDSSSILFLLKNILTEAEGFQIVGTASDGLEAAEKLSSVQTDIVTLDIHMPNQNGIEYLRANYNPKHPPVVMITAVSRDDSGLAITALHLGATDYVEKPTMNNFNDRADEIRTKLRVAHKAKKFTNGATLNIDLDKSFLKAFTVHKPETMQRIMVTSVSYRHTLIPLFKELTGTQPPTYIFIEGAESALHAFAKQLSSDCGKTVTYETHLTGKELPGSIILSDLRTCMPQLSKLTQDKKTAIQVFGDISKNANQNVMSWPHSQILIEENTNKDSALSKKATDVVPATSFIYLSNEYFMGDKK